MASYQKQYRPIAKRPKQVFNGFMAQVVAVTCPSGGTIPPGQRGFVPTNCDIQIYNRNHGIGKNGEYLFNEVAIGQTVYIGAGSDAGLLNRAMANLNGGSFDVLVTAWELPETLLMIASAAEAAWRATKRFLKGDVVGGIKALGQYEDLSRRQKGKLKEASKLNKRTADGVILENNLGWQPFLSSIDSGLAALEANFQEGKEFRKRVSNRKVSLKEKKIERSQRGFAENEQSVYRPRTEITLHGTVADSGTVQLASLGLANPATVAWNILPYSWLIDYFVGVNDYLSALTGTMGFTNVWATKLTISESLVLSVANAGRPKQSIVEIQRRPIEIIKPTFPASKLAGFTHTKMLNTLAVTRQRMRNQNSNHREEYSFNHTIDSILGTKR